MICVSLKENVVDLRLLKKDSTLEKKERQVKCNYNWELKKARIVY